MRKNILIIFSGLWLIVGIIGLGEGQVGATQFDRNLDETPANIRQVKHCEMPKSSSQQRPKPRDPNSEITFSDVMNILKSIDYDCDGISDYDDNCRAVYNPKQEDKNKNGIGDACEPKRLKSKSRSKNKRN